MLRESVGEGVRLLDDLQDVPAEVSRLRGYDVDVGFDLETTDTDPINSKIITIALKPKGKKAAVIDVRHWDARLLVLGPYLEPLFDGTVTLVGHNLKFDMEFMFAQLGLAGHQAYDTMLADQVILGLGVSSAAEKGIHFDMLSVAERYGLEVHKEERNWFIHLDERPEWNEPLPSSQLNYIRQDVSIVHRIKEAQAPLIEQAGLGEVVQLENRAMFPLAGIEVFGVQINREGWLEVIDRVKVRADELERVLHLGVEGEYEGLDLHILSVRHERYLDKWRPYQEWMKARDAYVATRKQEWDQKEPLLWFGDPPPTTWGDYKKRALEHWYSEHGKLTKPPPNKSGVNLGSWQQTRDGFNDLFMDRGLDIRVESVSEEDMEPLRSLHPLVGIYIEWSHARKIVTVYGRERGKKSKSFIELLDSSDRLRASYQQIGADTGRMSSHSPNFQQIPADGLGAELRHNVISAPGYTLVISDFSNIELRIVAELSGDKFLLDAFKSGMDVHAYTAIVMFELDKNPDYVRWVEEGREPKEWTNKTDAVVGGRTLESTSYRKISKTINYMLLYGAGVKRLASMLNVEERDAKTLLHTYYATFSTAIGWLNTQKERLAQAKQAKESKVFAATRSGRRRYFDIPHYPKHPANGSRVSVEAIEKWQEEVELWKKKNASIKRQLANTPVQGLSADITKEAAAEWYEAVGYADDMRLVAIIHDELIVECKPERVHEAKTVLRQVMCNAMERYLNVVDLGEIDPVQSSYWMH